MSKGVEILSTLQSACARNVLPETTVYQCIDQFKVGGNEVEIKHSPSKRWTQLPQKLIDSNRSLAC